MEQLFKDDPLGESNAICDLEDMFDSADENGLIDLTDYGLDKQLSIEYALHNEYCEAVSYYTIRATEKGKEFLAEYKKEMQELEKHALHAVG